MDDIHQPRWNSIAFHNASFLKIPPDFTERVKNALLKQPSPFTFNITYRIIKPFASLHHGLAIETFICPYTFQWPAATLPLPLTIQQLRSSIRAHELQLRCDHSISLAFQNLSLSPQTTDDDEMAHSSPLDEAFIDDNRMAHSSPLDEAFIDDDDDFDSTYL